MYFICKFVQKYCWRFFIFVGIVHELLQVSKKNFTFERVVLGLLTLVYVVKLYFLSIFFSYIDFIYQNFFYKLTWTSILYDYLLVALLWNTTRAPPAIIYQDFCSKLTWTSQYMFFMFVLACTFMQYITSTSLHPITYQDFCSNITWTSHCMFFILLLLALSCSTSSA